MATKDLVVSALVAAVVSAGTTYAVGRFGLLRTAEDVPSVMGMTAENARAILEGSGLLLAVAEEREDAHAEPGKILEQRPLNGSRIYRGESVSVIVARAPVVVKMPALVGQPLAEARQRLEALRLTAGRISEDVSDKIPAGNVVAQSVTAYAEVRSGAAVDLVVSKGAEPLPVPSVLGRSLNRAKEQLTKAGFTVGKISYKTSEEVDEGVVLQQTPAANQSAPKGSAVELVVSRYE